jgi:hypothetical protein
LLLSDPWVLLMTMPAAAKHPIEAQLKDQAEVDLAEPGGLLGVRELAWRGVEQGDGLQVQEPAVDDAGRGHQHLIEAQLQDQGEVVAVIDCRPELLCDKIMLNSR